MASNDGLISVEEPLCESVGTEQQMGSEILVESVSEQRNCLEAQPLVDPDVDSAGGADRSPGLCRNDNAGYVSCSEGAELCTVDREGLVGRCESTSVLEPEDCLNNEDGSDRCGLDENQDDVDGRCNIESGRMQLKEGDWCSEDGFGGSFAGCEAPLEVIPSAGSPGNGIQLDEHRDGNSVDCSFADCQVSSEVTPSTGLSGIGIQLNECRDDKVVNYLSSEGMADGLEEQDELPSEFVDVDVSRECNILSGKSLEAADEKSVVLTGIEGGGLCTGISPSRDGQMPSESSNAGDLVTNCNWNIEHIGDNGVSGVSGLSSGNSTEVFKACNQILPSLSFQRSLEDLQMPNSPSSFGQQSDPRSNCTVDCSLADRATVFMEEKSNVTTEKEAGIQPQISPIKVTISCLKEKSSNLPPNCIIEDSVPPQSCDTFSIANNSVDGLYSDTVAEVVDMKSSIVDAYNQTSFDLSSVWLQENDQSSEKVKESVERNVDGMHDMRVEIGAQTLSKVEKASNLIEDSAGLVPNSTIEKSVPLQLHQPFDIVSNDFFKTVNVPDVNDSPGHVDSNTSFDHSGRMDHGGNENFRADYLSPNKFSEIIALPAQRTSRSRQTPTKKAPRKRRNASKVLQPLGSDESVFKGAGRKRSCLSKPPRSSTWGLLGSVTQSFEESNGLQVHQISESQNEGSQKRRGSRKSGKQKQSGASGKLLGSKGPLTNVRLKVKFGKEIERNLLYAKASEVVDNSASANSIHVVNIVEDNWRQEATVKECQHTNKKLEKDETCQNGELPNKELESVSVIENSAEDEIQNCVGVPSHAIAVSSGGSVGSSYRDPGTSPDSEVINQIPEAHVDARPQEDCHGTVFTSDKDLSASGDFISSMRGKKKHEIPYAGNCAQEDGSLCPYPASTLKAKPSTRDGCRQNGSQDFFSGETFTLSPGGKASSNSSSGDKELSVEPQCFSGESDHGVTKEALKMERGADVDTDCNLDVVLGLHCAKNMLTFSNTTGQKPPKGKSRGSDSASKRSNSRKQRENEQKSANKRKVKEDKQLTCKVESLPDSEDPLADSNSSAVAECIGAPSLDVVPVDLGKQYISPPNAWVLCDACNKWRRIPAELADFIDETKCTWTCRENQDRDFADCSIPQEKSNAEINAELEISDASGEEDSGTQLHYKTLESRRPLVSQQHVASIKTNQFLHRNRKNQSIDEIMVCHCKLPKEGQLGCGEDCLNRMLNIECVRGTCPCGDLCSNQQFQKRRYSKLEKFRCGKKGFGLRSAEYICKGQFLIEYVGEVLDTHAYEARQKEYAVKGHRHFYFMTLNTTEVIDACAKGNLGRFINHSCDPNCRTEKWMVNGEVCIGLFALRDIKKGEEVTFDYNFVRVIGAAAKKCHCGSPQCQGYIGGDPLNTEIIIQDDSDEEYVEPVMIPEDGVAEDSRCNVVTSLDPLDGTIIQRQENASTNKEIDKSMISVGELDTTQREESKNRYLLDLQHSVPSFVQSVEVVQQAEDVTSRSTLDVRQEVFREKETAEKFINSFERPDPIKVINKPLSDDIDADKKSKFSTIEEEPVSSKVHRNVKISHSSSFVKKGKVRSIPLNTNKIQVVANKSHVLPFRPKRSIEGSVEEKLNELLDTDGGISKRKDSTKGYLKLLFLTAQSGDSGSGEAIKSNRDLSIILDALLKTKSRTVLVDIINKNGLRMLHNIMKMCRRDFNKIPILRKLLKVLEYLAEKPQILTQEHITGGPPCPGMESFTESILSLTEHGDKRVHDIARNFRNRWIPKSFRRHCFVDRDDGKMDFNRSSNYNRYSTSHDNWRDQTGRYTEMADSPKQSVVKTSPSANTVIQEGSSTPCTGVCATTETKVRKRKSRWDQPAATVLDLSSHPNKEQKIEFKQLESSLLPRTGDVTSHPGNEVRESGNCSSTVHNFCPLVGADMVCDGKQNTLDDAPPGFSSCLNTPVVSYSSTSSAIGHPQAKFVSRLPVSYGIPMSIMQQHGTPHAETADTWVVAPGMPFHPFPPLPPCPRHKKDPSHDVSPASVNQTSEGQQASCITTNGHSEESTPSTTGGTQADFGTPCADNQLGTKRERESSYEAPLGRRYFKQQKFNHPKPRLPWVRDRIGWGCNGNNFRGGATNIGIGTVGNELRAPYCSEDNYRVEKAGNNVNQHSHHH